MEAIGDLNKGRLSRRIGMDALCRGLRKVC